MGTCSTKYQLEHVPETQPDKVEVNQSKRRRKPVETKWNVFSEFNTHTQSILNQIKSNRYLTDNILIMEKYINECLDELNCNNDIEPSLPPSHTANKLIYDIIPDLTKYLLGGIPERSLEFVINHYFKTVLILCKRCIELDIEVFRMLENIFGFDIDDGELKNGFYHNCGSLIHQKRWKLDLYGNGEFSSTSNSSNVYVNDKFILRYPGCNAIYYFYASCHEMSYYKQYPIEELKCCGSYRRMSRLEKKNVSWFRIDNINFFEKIGGFDAILQRINNTKCYMRISDLVNIMRPIAQCRDLFNYEYYQKYVVNIKNALICYYSNLPDYIYMNIDYKQSEKILQNLHYFMNNDFRIDIINEVKQEITLQISLRQIKSPFINAKLQAMDRLNAIIESYINDKCSENMLFKSINIKMMKLWIDKHGILDKLLNGLNTNKQLIYRISSIFKLMDFENDLLDHDVNLFKYISCLIYLNISIDVIPLDVKKVYLKYCMYLTAGYSNKLIEINIPNEIFQIIVPFLCFDQFATFKQRFI